MSEEFLTINMDDLIEENHDQEVDKDEDDEDIDNANCGKKRG